MFLVVIFMASKREQANNKDEAGDDGENIKQRLGKDAGGFYGAMGAIGVGTGYTGNTFYE